jgi:hypothetical protein
MGSVRDINPERLTSLKEFQDALYILLNVVEDQQGQIRELTYQNQLLRDENNRLKGGNGRPDIKPSKKPGDISSQGKEHGKVIKDQGENKPIEDRSIEIDQEIKIDMDRSLLPADAVFKGFDKYIQQDLIIERNNKQFLLAVYYSPSEGKSYRAAFPEGMCKGHFGAGISSLINILHHYGNVTESKLCGLLDGFGVQISSGSVSNLLKDGHLWAVSEQSEILQAGLKNTAPKQMDCTGNREHGVNKVTHIITSPVFSIFYTLDSKSRIDCLRALQGNPDKGLQLRWHEGIEDLWQVSGVKKSDCDTVMALLKEKGIEVLSISELEELLKTRAADIYKKGRIVHILVESMALNYYKGQDSFPPLKVLLSDDAPEYGKIADYHALCWIHDARYYNKLAPGAEVLANILNTFKAQYWDFYQMLLDYKCLTRTQQQASKKEIITRFDQLFSTSTRYGALDKCLERTRANKEKLLRVLDFPDLPLHNNAAELAARRVVRKRDVSLHTMTKWGTELRDAFLSIIETAQKLGISAYQYIHDRVTLEYNMTSLAESITSKSSLTF